MAGFSSRLADARQAVAGWGLTGRAVAFLLAGVVAALFGWHQGWPPVIELGLFLALLPLLSLAVVLLRRDRVRARRLVVDPMPELGKEIPVTIEVVAVGSGIGPVIVADQAPESLGGTHQFGLARMGADGTARTRYGLTAAVRGEFDLGPARMLVADRLGLVARSEVIAEPTRILVTPQVVALAGNIPGGAVIGAGTGRTGSSGGTADDVIPRDYRPGDELRRVDWRATARTGSIMVRSEEQPWRATLEVLIDLRERSHTGGPAQNSLDAALSMVASVGVLALARHWDLRITDTTNRTLYAGSAADAGLTVARRELLRALALAEPTWTDAPAPGIARLGQGGGPLLAVLGDLPLTTMGNIARLVFGATPRMAVLVDTRDWQDTPSVGGASARERVDLLSAAGWRATPLHRAGVEASWAALRRLLDTERTQPGWEPRSQASSGPVRAMR